MVELGASKGFCSRLTGAGWGGCTVALCPSADKAAEFVQLLRTEYYEYRTAECAAGAADEQIFSTSPQGGAAIIVNDLA